MDKQSTFSSHKQGSLTFVVVTGKAIRGMCWRCALRNSEQECNVAPCRPYERKDGQYGYYAQPSFSNQSLIKKL